jgi:hypothetical protein
MRGLMFRCVDPVTEADCPTGTVLVNNKILGTGCLAFLLGNTFKHSMSSLAFINVTLKRQCHEIFRVCFTENHLSWT